METNQPSLCWRISVDNEDESSLAIAQLDHLGVEGFEEKEGELLAYSSVEPETKAAISSWLVHNDYEFTLEEILPQNWNKVWESNFQPLLIDDKVFLRAHFHEPHPTAAYQLIVTPKMSFGTGHHATTQFMIGKMLELDFTNKRVLDFGTGTGVLAILAEKLGAAQVLAIDNDDWSMENAAENILVNHCTQVDLQKSDQPIGYRFDIVLANINLHVLMQCAPALASVMNEGGQLLLSGILESDQAAVQQEYHNHGFKLAKGISDGVWTCILFTKK